MLSEARQKNMDKLDRAQNAQFRGLKTWGQGGPLGPLGSASGVCVCDPHPPITTYPLHHTPKRTQDQAGTPPPVDRMTDTRL